MGKGHDTSALEALRGKVLIAGPCAIRETADKLIHRLGRKNVYLSRECNNLCDTVQAQCHKVKNISL